MPGASTSCYVIISAGGLADDGYTGMCVSFMLLKTSITMSNLMNTVHDMASWKRHTVTLASLQYLETTRR